MESVIGKDFPKKIIPLLDSAKQSINIVVYDWRWYPNDPGCAVQIFNQSLVRASRRGVKIKAIVNNDGIVEILKSLEINARRVVLKNIIHAKLMIIDDNIVILGSHNYSQNAFTLNQEISVILSVPEKDHDFSRFFYSLFLT